MTYGLTPRQHDCLVYIERYIADHGYSPSYQDIANAMGIKAKSSVHRLLWALVQRGRIRMLPDVSRSISLCAEEDLEEAI